MKKINYKGRCEKRKVSKCREICRTYSRIQSAYLDVLEKDEEVISFECNVCLMGVSDDMYSSDFVIKRSDGTTCVRECVWRNNLNKPSYTKLLDMADRVTKKLKTRTDKVLSENLRLAKKLEKLQNDKEKCETERFANVDRFMAGELEKDDYNGTVKLDQR